MGEDLEDYFNFGPAEKKHKRQFLSPSRLEQNSVVFLPLFKTLVTPFSLLRPFKRRKILSSTVNVFPRKTGIKKNHWTFDTFETFEPNLKSCSPRNI